MLKYEPVLVDLMERGMQDILKIMKSLKDELKNILVKSLFHWTEPFNISSFSNFSHFVEFCSSFRL
jgi:hypothetical protein